MRIASTAHEDVDCGKAAFRPRVNADVGFRQNDDTGDTSTLAELMHVCMQDRRPGRSSSVTKNALDALRIGKVASPPKIQQQVASSIAEAVLVDEIIGADRDATANHVSGGIADHNLVLTVLRHFALFPT